MRINDKVRYESVTITDGASAIWKYDPSQNVVCTCSAPWSAVVPPPPCPLHSSLGPGHCVPSTHTFTPFPPGVPISPPAPSGIFDWDQYDTRTFCETCGKESVPFDKMRIDTCMCGVSDFLAKVQSLKELADAMERERIQMLIDEMLEIANDDRGTDDSPKSLNGAEV